MAIDYMKEPFESRREGLKDRVLADLKKIT